MCVGGGRVCLCVHVYVYGCACLAYVWIPEADLAVFFYCSPSYFFEIAFLTEFGPCHLGQTV